MLFDSHCHLHDKKFDEDRDAVIERAREAGVTRILSLGDIAEHASEELAGQALGEISEVRARQA